jgi:hypothetical protein
VVPNKLRALCSALKEVASEFEAACMERNSLREQVRDGRDRKHTLTSQVVCLTDQLKPF